MKRILLTTLTFAASAMLVPAQGLVNFINTSTTLIRLDPDPFPVVTPAGSLRFELFTAPEGTLNSSLFTSTGLFATNLAAAGRLSGGINLVGAGLPLGGTAAILVRGWSSTLGSNWVTASANLNAGSFDFLSTYVGESDIAPNFLTGGFNGVENVPTSAVFGGASGIPGGMTFNLWLPEPSALALTSLAFASLWVGRRRRSLH